MEKSGKSLREIAKEIDVSHVTLARLMKARTLDDYNLGAEVVDKLCKYFKCKSITDILIFKKS